MKREIILKYLIGVLLCLTSYNISGAQENKVTEEDSLSKVQMIELSFDMIQPLSDFRRKLNGNPVGFSTRYFWQARVNKPVFLGLAFNYAQLFSISEDYTDFIDGFQVELKQLIKSHYVGFHLIFRYYPTLNIPIFQAYIEGFAGTKIMFASDVVRDIETDESLQFEFTDGSIAMSYGIASGFQLNVKDGIWYLNGRLSYELGTSSSYLGLNPVESQSIFDLETRNAVLQMIRYQIGFTFVF